AGDVEGVIRLSGLLLGIIVVLALFEVAFSYLSTWIGQRAMFDLRRQMMRRILSQDVAFFDRNPVGRLITRMTSDVETLNEMLSTGMVTVLGEMLVIVGVVGVMFFHNAALTGIVLLSLPLILIVMQFFRRNSRAG